MILFYIIIMITEYTRFQLEALPKRKLIDLFMQLQDTLLRLEERIRQLEGQLHKDSHNSHISPSQSKPLPIKNLREPTGLKSGGQPGHPGHTLKLMDNPTRTITYTVTRCQRCGQDLSRTPINSYERRQVFDLPPLNLSVTEYRIEKKLCSCGQIAMAHFPPAIQAPVQYGRNIQTLVSVLSAHGYLSQKRISETLEYLIGCPVSDATICTIQNILYQKLAGFADLSKRQLLQSPVIHNDETGISVEGQRNWAHVTSTAKLTHYAVDSKRGQEALERIGILPHFQGTTVHDGWKSYSEYKQCRHGSCNVHHLRELTFFKEEEKAAWAQSLKEHLLEGKTAVDTAKRDGKDHLEWEFVQQYSYRYRQILESALEKMPTPVRRGQRGRLKKTAQQNLIERLLTHQASVLRFMIDFRVPFDNNLAERDLRMFKVKIKVSGTFRSSQGAENFARIRSYISTVRKQGRNVFLEIKHALEGKPFLLSPGTVLINY
jgi:transposase